MALWLTTSLYSKIYLLKNMLPYNILVIQVSPNTRLIPYNHESPCCFLQLQVNDSLASAVDTSRELHKQQESLDRSNRMLNKMDEDLTQSKRAMRIISSPFGGIVNYFARDGKKKDKQPQSSTSKLGATSNSSGHSSSWQAQRQVTSRQQYESSGNTVVDDNLDEVERGLAEMKRVGLEIGNQLDHSMVTIDELNAKVIDKDSKLTDLNKKIGRKIR